MNKVTTNVVCNECIDALHPSCGSMDTSQRLLYERLMQFDFDEGAAILLFSMRLARENAWTLEFAQNVIHEYKRFLFLMVHADHPVSPSDQVDQAWHLHLTYTRSYWDRLCNEVVGRALHHLPTNGGCEEAQKFNHWYRYTLESYQRIFGQTPPSDIWPDPVIRFGDDLYFQRINTRHNWVVAKLRVMRARSRRAIWLASIAVLLSVSIWTAPLVVASTTKSANQTDPSVGSYLLIIFIMIIFSIAVSLFARRCATCKRLGALEKSGITETRNDNLVWEEFCCKHCGKRSWREEKNEGGNGGGCGG